MNPHQLNVGDVVLAVGARRLGATPQVAVKSKSPRTVEEEEPNNEKVIRKSRRVKAKLDSA